MIIVINPYNQPDDFTLLAQNAVTLEICGETNENGYFEVEEIPEGFEQRCLPPEAGKFLTYQQIKSWKSDKEKIINLESSLAETNVTLLEFMETILLGGM